MTGDVPQRCRQVGRSVAGKVSAENFLDLLVPVFGRAPLHAGVLGHETAEKSV
jgi:hypothetical protein